MAIPAFDEVQFPTDISFGSEGGPEFSTEVTELGNGFEQRQQNWTQGRERWNVAYGVREIEKLKTLLEFFRARGGRARGFRFKNHLDFEVDQEEALAVGTTGKVYQIVKRYGSGVTAFVRDIKKPVEGTVVMWWWINGQWQHVTGGYPWTVDAMTGLVSFTVDMSAYALAVSCEFDVPCRFDTDVISIRLADYLAAATVVPIVEIRL